MVTAPSVSQAVHNRPISAGSPSSDKMRRVGCAQMSPGAMVQIRGELEDEVLVSANLNGRAVQHCNCANRLLFGAEGQRSAGVLWQSQSAITGRQIDKIGKAKSAGSGAAKGYGRRSLERERSSGCDDQEHLPRLLASAFRQ